MCSAVKLSFVAALLQVAEAHARSSGSHTLCGEAAAVLIGISYNIGGGVGQLEIGK